MTQNELPPVVRAPIWAVDSPQPRKGPHLDRARIVASAVAIADSEGMDAVTLRRVAADLGSSPMSLYRHAPGGKDDLIDLMLDQVLGEHDLTSLPSGDWSADLTLLGNQRREATLRHPWSTVPAARPTLGPNGMHRMDTALAIFQDAPVSAGRRAWAVGVIDAYVYGATSQELAQHNEQTRTGLTAEDWQKTVEPYVAQALATGDYPYLATYVTYADDYDPAEQFHLGLTATITGVIQALA